LSCIEKKLPNISYSVIGISALFAAVGDGERTSILAAKKWKKWQLWGMLH